MSNRQRLTAILPEKRCHMLVFGRLANLGAPESCMARTCFEDDLHKEYSIFLIFFRCLIFHVSFFGGMYSVHWIYPAPRMPVTTSNTFLVANPLSTQPSFSTVTGPGVHPGRLTWNMQITHLERKMIFQTSMIMFHVNLQGCGSKVCRTLKEMPNHPSEPSQTPIICSAQKREIFSTEKTISTKLLRAA